MPGAQALSAPGYDLCGTGWAVMTVANDPGIAAAVLFYGGWSVHFSRMRSRVLGHYVDMDGWYPFDGAKEMSKT